MLKLLLQEASDFGMPCLFQKMMSEIKGTVESGILFHEESIRESECNSNDPQEACRDLASSGVCVREKAPAAG